MEFEDRLRDVTVIGAAGKMGRGIALLLAESMASGPGAAGTGTEGRRPRLTLIDTREEGLAEAVDYIRTHAARRAARRAGDDGDNTAAEKRAAEVSAVVETTTDLHRAAAGWLVFEALPEVESLKLETLSQLAQLCPHDAWFLSNTSSLPIGELDRQAGLDGRLIGFHFYNPPPVQKLLELIPAASTCSALVQAAQQFAVGIGKTVVPSLDVAGFIGNGHFIRECRYALGRMEQMSGRVGWPGALYAVDRATREGLLRPMGIFQVMDYAGVDICAAIMAVMDKYITAESFAAVPIERLLTAGARGGQRTDGSQRDGFFRYDGYEITDVYDFDSGDYLPVQTVAGSVELGELAPPGCSWKELRSDTDVDEGVRRHFDWLGTQPGTGARMALEFRQESRQIAQRLVDEGVARCREDVDVVVTTGFSHLYGPLGTEASSA